MGASQALLALLCLCVCCGKAAAEGAVASVPPDGNYLLRLLFVRHGFSCANVPWNACTTHGERLTPEGMGEERYKEVTRKLDELLRPKEPESMVGMAFDFGIKPRGWKIPGRSKTADGKADDCLIKVRNTSLVDDQYDEFGNLVALRQLIKDPHVTACDLQKAEHAGEVLAQWLEAEDIEFDLVGSSSLKRSIETVELMYMRNPYKASTRKVEAIAILPYVNEKNEGTPFQPENFPYDPEVQERQMSEELGKDTTPLASGLTQGVGAYPREDQQWDKFKAVLALELLPGLVQGRRDGWTPNVELVNALEAGREEGRPKVPEQSNWPQVRDDPLREITAGQLRYVWEKPAPSSEYDSLKKDGSREFVLAIGSHSGLLMNYCLEGRARPNSLSVLEKRVTVNVATDADGQTSFRVAEIEGPCRLILEAPAAPEPGSLTEGDLGEACRSPFNVAPFMDLAPPPVDGQESMCVTAGRAALRLAPGVLAEAAAPQGQLRQQSAGVIGLGSSLVTGSSLRLALLALAAVGSVAAMLTLGRAARRGRRREVRTALLSREGSAA